jgi:hypothetical protein
LRLVELAGGSGCAASWSVDYENSSGVNRYKYDVMQHGPIVGLTIGF